MKSPDAAPTKVTIAISLGGRPVATLALTALEYDLIRSMPAAQALHLVMSKDPIFRENGWLVEHIVHHIIGGTYTVREKRGRRL
jgi:hypothetical protein